MIFLGRQKTRLGPLCMVGGIAVSARNNARFVGLCCNWPDPCFWGVQNGVFGALKCTLGFWDFGALQGVWEIARVVLFFLLRMDRTKVNREGKGQTKGESGHGSGPSNSLEEVGKRRRGRDRGLVGEELPCCREDGWERCDPDPDALSCSIFPAPFFVSIPCPCWPP